MFTSGSEWSVFLLCQLNLPLQCFFNIAIYLPYISILWFFPLILCLFSNFTSEGVIIFALKNQLFFREIFRGKSYIYSRLLTPFSSVQFSSVTQSCPIICDPMNRSMPGLPVHHQLLEFTQTHVHRVSDAIQPSHPLSSPSPPGPNPSQHQSLFQWVSSSH